jgi:hypothetical protein
MCAEIEPYAGAAQLRRPDPEGPSRKTRPLKIPGQVCRTGHSMARFGRSSPLTRVPQDAQLFRRKRSIPDRRDRGGIGLPLTESSLSQEADFGVIGARQSHVPSRGQMPKVWWVRE